MSLRYVEPDLTTHRASLNVLQENLDRRVIARIHRSTIVNIDSIVTPESPSHGEFNVTLKSRTRARVSRTYGASAIGCLACDIA